MRAATLAAVVLTSLTAATMAVPGHAVMTTVPETRVTLRLTVSGHEPATVRLQLGTDMHVVLADGTNVTLTPDVVAGLQEIAVREGTDGTTTRLSVNGNGLAVDPLHELQIEWLESQQIVRGQSSQNGPCTTCCITCDGLTYCACEVFAPCGHCCCPNTCVCEGQNAQ